MLKGAGSHNQQQLWSGAEDFHLASAPQAISAHLQAKLPIKRVLRDGNYFIAQRCLRGLLDGTEEYGVLKTRID